MADAVPTVGAAPTGKVGTPGICTLGDISFRIAPTQISYEYHLDSTVINTIGGRVIQVYGATLSDLYVQGLFGSRYNPANNGNVQAIGTSSMQQARDFAIAIAKMVDQQGQRPTNDQLTRKDKTPMNQPFRFTYTGDGVHEWDFQVYVKSLSDVNDPEFAISHKTGKYSYGYNLTLFIVEDNTNLLKQIATDAYIARLSQGIGWQRTTYNGPMSDDQLKAYLQANSPDGTIHGLVLKEYEDAAKGLIPAPGTAAANPIPGGADTAGQAAGNPNVNPKGAGVTTQNSSQPAPGVGAPGAPGGPAPGNTIPGQNGAPPIIIPGLGPK